MVIVRLLESNYIKNLLKLPNDKNYNYFKHTNEKKRNILEKNGSAIDAAIATGLCNSIMNAQSMGIGGGFFMTIYLK